MNEVRPQAEILPDTRSAAGLTLTVNAALSPQTAPMALVTILTHRLGVSLRIDGHDRLVIGRP
jgi:predicted Zn-dependent protease